MNKMNLNDVDDILNMVLYECPYEMFGELSSFQCDCEKFDSCFECWHYIVTTYQNEQLLKSANDESEDK